MTLSPTKIKNGNTPNSPAVKIVNHIPGILKERGLTAQDLGYGARIMPNTAYRWSGATTLPRTIDLDVLARICLFLGISVSEALELTTG